MTTDMSNRYLIDPIGAYPSDLASAAEFASKYSTLHVKPAAADSRPPAVIFTTDVKKDKKAGGGDRKDPKGRGGGKESKGRGGGRGGRGGDSAKAGGKAKAVGDKDLSHIECYNCHEFGHYKSKCPALVAYTTSEDDGFMCLFCLGEDSGDPDAADDNQADSDAASDTAMPDAAAAAPDTAEPAAAPTGDDSQSDSGMSSDSIDMGQISEDPSSSSEEESSEEESSEEEPTVTPPYSPLSPDYEYDDFTTTTNVDPNDHRVLGGPDWGEQIPRSYTHPHAARERSWDDAVTAHLRILIANMSVDNHAQICVEYLRVLWTTSGQPAAEYPAAAVPTLAEDPILRQAHQVNPFGPESWAQALGHYISGNAVPSLLSPSHPIAMVMALVTHMSPDTLHQTQARERAGTEAIGTLDADHVYHSQLRVARQHGYETVTQYAHTVVHNRNLLARLYAV
jgi:hypothetical protein